jgi:hypothetical protein
MITNNVISQLIKSNLFELASPKTLSNVYKGVIFIDYILTITGFKSSEFFEREGDGKGEREK